MGDPNPENMALDAPPIRDATKPRASTLTRQDNSADSMSCGLDALVGAALDHGSSKRKRFTSGGPDVEGCSRYQTESNVQHRQRALYDEEDPMLMASEHQDTIPITYKQGYMPFHTDPSARKTNRKNRSSYESICNDSPIVVAPEPSFSEGGQNSRGFHVSSENPHHFSHEAGSRTYPHDQPPAHTYTTDSSNMRFPSDAHPPSSYSSKGHHPAVSHFEHDPKFDQPTAAWNPCAYSSSAYEHESRGSHAEESYAHGSQGYYAAPAHSHNRSPPHTQPEQSAEYLQGHKQEFFPHLKSSSSFMSTHAHSAYGREDRYLYSPRQIPDGSNLTYDEHGNLYVPHATHADSYAHRQMRRHSMTMHTHDHEHPGAHPNEQAYRHPSYSDGRVRIPSECVGQYNDGEARTRVKHNTPFTGQWHPNGRDTQKDSVPTAKTFVFITETGQKKSKKAKTQASTPSYQAAAVKTDVTTIPMLSNSQML